MTYKVPTHSRSLTPVLFTPASSCHAVHTRDFSRSNNVNIHDTFAAALAPKKWSMAGSVARVASNVYWLWFIYIHIYLYSLKSRSVM